MAKIIVSAGQSLLDVALWLMGGTDALFDLADANGLAITDALRPGQVLTVPDGYTVNQELVNYYSSRSIRVNTANGLVLAAATPEEPDELNDFDEADFDDSDFF